MLLLQFPRNGVWSDVLDFACNPCLCAAVHQLPDIVRSSKSKNTNKKYDQYFVKFTEWCKCHSLESLPANVSTVCIFFSDLFSKKVSSAVLDSYFYAIKWKHEFHLFDNPCDHRLVKLTYDGCRKELSCQSKKKQPINIDILQRIIDVYSVNDVMNLKNLRLCLICILGFSGFLRYSEISLIQMSDIHFNDDHVSIRIRKSKTDQFKHGTLINIARTNTALCPVTWLLKYIKAANLTLASGEYLFSKVRFLKSKDKYVLCDTGSPCVVH